MNATELYLADGRSAGIYFCSECRIVAKDRDHAEQCCQPWHCRQCGKECDRYRTLCYACLRARDEEAWQRRLSAAEEIPAAEYDGPVYYEGGSNDGFFFELEELIEDFTDNGEEPPEFAMCCKPREFYVDVQQVIDDVECRLELDCCEDYEPDYIGLDEFEAACDKFSRENQHVKTYWPDSKRKVRVR